MPYYRYRGGEPADAYNVAQAIRRYIFSDIADRWNEELERYEPETDEYGNQIFYHGSPVPIEGGKFNEDWFTYLSTDPRFAVDYTYDHSQESPEPGYLYKVKVPLKHYNRVQPLDSIDLGEAENLKELRNYAIEHAIQYGLPGKKILEDKDYADVYGGVEPIEYVLEEVPRDKWPGGIPRLSDEELQNILRQQRLIKAIKRMYG